MVFASVKNGPSENFVGNFQHEANVFNRWMKLAAVVILAIGTPGTVYSQSPWPAAPIRLVVPFPAGSALDVVSRMVTDRITASLGQPIVVEARPGADGNIGTERVARSAPDGYTWLAISPPFTIQPSVRAQALNYDPLRDFQPVALFGTSPFVFVVPASLPVNSLKEFVDYAKARPGQLSYSATPGALVHLIPEIFKKDAGIEMALIGYPGQNSAISDLLAGRVQFMTLGLVLAEPLIKSGKLKALAVLRPERHPRLTDIPTVVELGYPNLVITAWFGLVMPRQTPKSIVERVNSEVMRALRSPEMIEKMTHMGVDAPKQNSPEDFAQLLKEEMARWKKVVKDASIVVE